MKHKVKHHWQKHRKHWTILVLSLATAQALLTIGKELVVKRLELGTAVAGIGIVLSD